jgi:hypothetical protein
MPSSLNRGIWSTPVVEHGVAFSWGRNVGADSEEELQARGGGIV